MIPVGPAVDAGPHGGMILLGPLMDPGLRNAAGAGPAAFTVGRVRRDG
jgi:hypothetical protein